MPKIVDHAARRAEIVDGLLELIARDGMAAATSRSLASHLGVSNGALWRYFRGKDDLMAATYRTVIDKSNRRVSEATRGRTGVDAVLAMLDTFFPVTPETKDEAKVVLAFWGIAALDPEPGLLSGPEMAAWAEEFTGLLGDAVRSGELRPDTPVEALGNVLISVVVNAQLEYVFQGEDGTERMRQMRDLLESFRA